MKLIGTNDYNYFKSNILNTLEQSLELVLGGLNVICVHFLTFCFGKRTYRDAHVFRLILNLLHMETSLNCYLATAAVCKSKTCDVTCTTRLGDKILHGLIVCPIFQYYCWRFILM